MGKDYRIEEMTPSDLKIAVLWAKKEGWKPGLYDATCFYQVDPQGFFVGRLNGKVISVVSAVNYDDFYAFSGFFIVHPRYRGKRYGLMLAETVASHVSGRNVGCDGVIHMISRYERMGFQFAHRNARYELKNIPKLKEDVSNIQLLLEFPFEELSRYDRLHFPASRDEFLKCWISQPKSLALGYVKDQRLKGYGVIRICDEGYKIGPLFADTPEISNILLLKLVEHAQGATVYLDVPENNPHATDLLKPYAAKKVFETARMYTQAEPIVLEKEIYGITSYELG